LNTLNIIIVYLNNMDKVDANPNVITKISGISIP
jgi:hypothetical protein